MFLRIFYRWVAHSDGSCSSEATGAIQCEASPFHPERDSSVVKIFVGCEDVRRWGVRDAFCRLFQLHCQPRKVFVDDDDEESEVQNGCCTFVPRKSNKKTGLTKVVLAAA